MKKDAYYFSHDANAQDDPKCMILIDKLGSAGYGIFWLLIEKLRAEKDYKLSLSILGIFAKRWKTTVKKIDEVIRNYGLFKIGDDNFFFSQRLINSMDAKSEKARQSALSRWENATAMRPHATAMRNDAIRRKKSKVNIKESKEKKNPLAPDLSKSNLFRNPVVPTESEVLEAFLQNGGTEEMSKKFYDNYQATGWFYKNSAITNFRNLVYSYVDNWKKNLKNNSLNGKSESSAPPLKHAN